MFWALAAVLPSESPPPSHAAFDSVTLDRVRDKWDSLAEPHTAGEARHSLYALTICSHFSRRNHCPRRAVLLLKCATVREQLYS